MTDFFQAFLQAHALPLYLGAVFLVWTRRIFWVRSLGQKNPPIEKVAFPPRDDMKVSVIVPAKNEEKNIGNCLGHLFKQYYKNMEIIVVDDRSTDRTPHLLENFKKLSLVPFRIVTIEKLPPGWTGKNHAMTAGAKAASGQWLLFTDADTTHEPESVGSALKTAVGKQIDLLTLSPVTESRSYWEQTVQPLAFGSLALSVNSEKVNDPKSRVVLANGQYILVKKSVYEAVGGNEAVRSEVVEDVELAKKVKAAGYTLRFLNGTQLYSTRMYSSLKEIKTGWTRIFTYLFNKNVFAIAHKILLFAVMSLGPFAALFYELFLKFTGSAGFDALAYYLSWAVCGWIVVIRFIGNRLLKCNPWYALLHPLGSLVMVWILSACVWRVLFNRPSVWRGDLHK